MDILIAYLLGIVSAILPKGLNRKNENSETGDEGSKPQPSGYPERISVEINLSPKEAQRYYSEEDKTYKLQRRIFWVNLITLLALALYTVFTYRILSATQKSAAAAKSAADTADVTMKLAYRPRLLLIGIDPRVASVNGTSAPVLDNHRLTTQIVLPNTGPFPARNVRFFRYSHVGSRDQIKKVSRLSWKWRKRSSVKIAERTYEKRAQALHC